jgi:Mlc titration factor MtfA (ptsG expression regulator)
MIFDWFREHHHKELLEQPFPTEWLPILEENVGHYAYLNEEERGRLRADMRIFADEKSWEGCGGLEITDEVKVTIAAQACLLLLNLEHNYFSNVESILVYPTAYVAKQLTVGPDGVVEEGPSQRLGEAWQIGPVILSWMDVKSGSMNESDGHNVVLHEFAHKLDLGEGGVDGVPRLEDTAQYERWAEVMSAEYRRLVEDTEKGHATLLDEYAATNAGEFFAVATECFFEKGRQMRDRHTELYDVLKSYYRQDTAARMDAHIEAVREQRQHEHPH